MYKRLARYHIPAVQQKMAVPCVVSATAATVTATDRLSRSAARTTPSILTRDARRRDAAATAVAPAASAASARGRRRRNVRVAPRCRAAAASVSTRDDEQPCTSGSARAFAVHSPWTTTRRACRRPTRVSARSSTNARGGESVAPGDTGAVRHGDVQVENNKPSNDDDDDDVVLLERDDAAELFFAEKGNAFGAGGGRVVGEEAASGAGRGEARAWNTVPAASGLPREALPKHVALIMDGNARWAAERRLPVSVGHERAGTSALFCPVLSCPVMLCYVKLCYVMSCSCSQPLSYRRLHSTAFYFSPPWHSKVQE